VTRAGLACALSALAAAMPLKAQSVPPDSRACAGLRYDRAAVLGGAWAGVELVAFAAFAGSWYEQDAPQGFHFNSGGSVSASQDELLHAAVAYHLVSGIARAWEWACVSPATAGRMAAATVVLLALPKEIIDGIHDDGFSITDVAYTLAGAGLGELHRTHPSTRVVALKVGYWPSAEYRQRAGTVPRLYSDYAGQRYWLSFNPARSVTPGWVPGWWPGWLGLAVGHSTTPWSVRPPGHHVWYLALDIDWGRLPIEGRGWARIARVLDAIHVPAPGLRLREGGLAVGLF